MVNFNIILVFTNDSILAALCQMRESADADERVEFTELFNLFNLSEDDSDKEVEEQPVRFFRPKILITCGARESLESR